MQLKYSNNPLNLPYDPVISRYKGFLGNSDGYCSFTCLSLGVRAACVYFMRHLRRNHIYSLNSLIADVYGSSFDEYKNILNFVCNKMLWRSTCSLLAVCDYAKLISVIWEYYNPGDPFNSYFYVLDIIRSERVKLYPLRYGSISRI